MPETIPSHPSIYEINDPSSEHYEDVVISVSTQERADRASEADDAREAFAEQRVAALGDARDAVMAAYEQSDRNSNEAHQEMLDFEIPTPETTEPSVPSVDDAITAAEVHRAEIIARKEARIPEVAHETELPEKEKSVVEHVHERIEHAITVLENVEKGVDNYLGGAQESLRRLDQFLRSVDDRRKLNYQYPDIKEFELKVQKVEVFLNDLNRAMTAGVTAVRKPLQLLETVTRTEQDENNLRELEDSKPTKIDGDDLTRIRQKMWLIRNTMDSGTAKRLTREAIELVDAYMQRKPGDSASKVVLKHIAKDLEKRYTESRN